MRDKGAKGNMRVIRNIKGDKNVNSSRLEHQVNGFNKWKKERGAGDNVGKLLEASPAERA